MQIKLLNRETDYALRALAYLCGNPGKTCAVGEMAKELGIPRPFLRRILQVLSREGILEARRGKGGGFRAGHGSGELSLLDIMELFQGRLRLNHCLFLKKRCPRTKECPLRKRLSRIEKLVAGELRRIRLDSLFDRRFSHGGENTGTH